MRITGYLLVLTTFAVVSIGQTTNKKVSREEALSAITFKVAPAYPVIAKQLRVQGEVELSVIVTETGEVSKVDIVSGNALLTPSATEAVKRWKFKPFLEDGKPTRATVQVTVEFKI